MSQYALNTSVSVDSSIAEIRRTLTKYGADRFAYGEGIDEAQVMFRLNGKMMRFDLTMPNRDDKEFTRTPSRGNLRSQESALLEWEKACRQRWRALVLVIKAKLEAIESGISTLESEFMANIMLPNGSTVGEFMLPQIEESYKIGGMPKMLMDGSG